jgi:hypothetical protein
MLSERKIRDAFGWLGSIAGRSSALLPSPSRERWNATGVNFYLAEFGLGAKRLRLLRGFYLRLINSYRVVSGADFS